MKIYTHTTLKLSGPRTTTFIVEGNRLYWTYLTTSIRYWTRLSGGPVIYAHLDDEEEIVDLIEESREAPWLELLVTTGITKTIIRNLIEEYENGLHPDTTYAWHQF